MSLKKVAVVTGCSGGIGPACALELARRGFDIAAVQRRNADACIQAVNKLGRECRSYSVDITRRANVTEFYEQLMADFGRLDALVNCAGACPRTPVDDLTEEELDEILAVNTKGPLWMILGARPLMWQSGGGSIVNISSLAAQDGGNACSIAYTMSKAAVDKGALQLAKFPAPPNATGNREDHPVIRINTIAPGPVATEMLQSMDPDALAKMKNQTLTGRLTTIQEVARGVAYYTCDATNTTGDTMQINGGSLRR